MRPTASPVSWSCSVEYGTRVLTCTILTPKSWGARTPSPELSGDSLRLALQANNSVLSGLDLLLTPTSSLAPQVSVAEHQQASCRAVYFLLCLK